MLRRHHRIKLSFTREMLNLPAPVKAVGIIAFIYNLGWGMIDPYLFIYLKTLFGNYTYVGLLASSLYFFAIIWSLPLGQLLNRISEKTLILITLIMYIPMGYLLLSLKTFTQFFFLKIYNSLTAASIWLGFEGYLREHTTKKNAYEAIGLFDTLCSLSYVIGPVLGAILIVKYGFVMFYAISITASIAFILGLALKKQKKEGLLEGIKDVIRKDKIAKKEIKDFIKNKKLIAVEILSCMYTFTLASMGMLLPLFLKEQNASFMQIGIMSSLYYLPLLSESYFSVFANKKRLVSAALILSTALLTTMFFINSLYTLFVLVFLFSVCSAAITAVIRGKVTNSMPKSEIGELSGVDQSAKYLAAGLGLVASGIIGDVFGLKYVLVMVALSLLAILLLTSKKKLIP